MSTTKTLANCTLKEFLQQANRIRKEVETLFKAAKIKDIRKHLPVFKGDETPEEKAEMVKEQGKKNLSDILDACIEENIDLTVKVIGLMCFKSEEEASKMEVSEFYDVVFDLFNSKRVMDFFMKWVNSVRSNMETSL